MIDILQYISDHLAAWGYVGLFAVMFLESMCISIPSEVTLPLTGYLVFQQKLSFIPAVLTATTASVLGSSIVYHVAKRGGRSCLNRWGYLIGLTSIRLQHFEDRFQRFGTPVIALGRLTPFVRGKTSIVAGLSNIDYLAFAGFTALGMFLHCLIGVAAGYYLGANYHIFTRMFMQPILPAAIAALIMLGIFIVHLSGHNKYSSKS